MSAADLLQDLQRDVQIRDAEVDRIWQDFTATYREICDLEEQLARKRGKLCDLSMELQSMRKDVEQDLTRALVS